MVRLSTLILSTLSIVSVSAQVSADAQYVLASTASYLAIAQNLAAKAGSIDTLSCTLYHLNMSPFAEIVPILKELTVDFNEDGQRIYSFKPPLSLANPADVAVGRTIEDNLVRATLSVSRALDDIIEGEAINPCSVVPVIGKDISAALKSFKLATIPYYISIVVFDAPEEIDLRRTYVSLDEKLDRAIEAYEGLVPV